MTWWSRLGVTNVSHVFTINLFVSFENLKSHHSADNKFSCNDLLFHLAILKQFGTLELMESPLKELLSFSELSKLVTTFFYSHLQVAGTNPFQNSHHKMAGVGAWAF